jgi:hypothetical protein
MKNIQIIDGADNCVYDIYSATEDEFNLIFPQGTDIAFIGEVYDRENEEVLDLAFTEIWKRRIAKKDAMGTHGILFYENDHKMEYYPTRTDEGACNPDGTKLRG